MNLQDYPTPEADKWFEFNKGEPVAGSAHEVLQEMEQRLAACRAALEEIRQISKDGPTIIRDIAQRALTLTSPQP